MECFELSEWVGLFSPSIYLDLTIVKLNEVFTSSLKVPYDATYTLINHFHTQLLVNGVCGDPNQVSPVGISPELHVPHTLSLFDVDKWLTTPPQSLEALPPLPLKARPQVWPN